MKTFIALTTLFFSLSGFCSTLIPAHVDDLAIENVAIVKVATEFQSRECTEYDGRFTDCADPVAYKRMVEVTVSYSDKDLSIESQQKFLTQNFDLIGFTNEELESIRHNKREALKLFTLSVRTTEMTYVDSFCESEYGCINTQYRPTEFQVSRKVKIVEVLKK